MGIKLKCTLWMCWKLLALPRLSLVHVIIIFDFEYNLLIISIYNTSTKIVSVWSSKGKIGILSPLKFVIS